MKNRIHRFNTSFKTFSAKRLAKKYPRVYAHILKSVPATHPTEAIYQFVNDITEFPVCKQCNQKAVTFLGYTKGYVRFCSSGCVGKSPDTRSASKKTMLEKHGVEYAMQSVELVKKYQDGMIKKHGVPHPSMVEEFCDNRKSTMVERYGVEYAMQSVELKERYMRSLQSTYGEDVRTPLQSEEIRQKFRDTCMERYGVDYPAQIDEIFDKVRKTNIARYGMSLPLQNDICMENLKLTNTGRYGVPYATQNPEVMKKMRETNEKSGHWRQQDLKTSIELYYAQVIQYTNKQELHLLENFEKRGRAGIDGAYHIDHKISIRYGFMNSIAPYIIGNINNLEMLTWQDNIYKSYKCSIDIEELCFSIFLNRI